MATFSSGVKCFRSFLIRSLRYLNGGTLSPVPTEAGHWVRPVSSLACRSFFRKRRYSLTYSLLFSAFSVLHLTHMESLLLLIIRCEFRNSVYYISHS